MNKDDEEYDHLVLDKFQYDRDKYEMIHEEILQFIHKNYPSAYPLRFV